MVWFLIHTEAVWFPPSRSSYHYINIDDKHYETTRFQRISLYEELESLVKAPNTINKGSGPSS